MKRTGKIESSGTGLERTKPFGAAAYGHEQAVPPSGATLVAVRQEEVVLPTYLPAAPNRAPMFLEKRVYQGSSGKVYPLPFTDRIAETPVTRKWKAVWLENEFLRVLILPEIGGRIHALQDKTNNYDLIYHQRVIKPALVGLAGPWISGGIEFNWPQHHRPATFMPTDCEIERHADGSATVWCSDHDPMSRMKGMHGVCLHPGKAFLELKVRAYNRTGFVQTFLWWANVATRVHEGYQSFFPPDVQHVADHARRSTSEYPLAQGIYYGVNYKERGRSGVPRNERPRQFVPPHCGDRPDINGASSEIPLYAANDLSFYANIPTPCSYMALGSKEDFFGGYDFKKHAGLVHIASHHISPGKKQWTWGNHEFGYAWDRNLTDPDGTGEYAPYIELMAGVYTDNQPDFSFLQPGETKSWSQFWYPIQSIGPPSHANLEAAISLKLSGSKARIGVCVTSSMDSAHIQLSNRERVVFMYDGDLKPGLPVLEEVELGAGARESELRLSVINAGGREVIAYQTWPRVQATTASPATEPPLPREISSSDQLYLTGVHLEQYRHATRCPTDYWREALRRDSNDYRCHNAMGMWHLRRGEFAQSEKHFRAAIDRLTILNANPCDGEPFYNLGQCLRYQALLANDAEERSAKSQEAYDSFYKAAWNQAWVSAARHALAELDCVAGRWASALDHLNHSLRTNADNTRARDLKVVVLRKLGAVDESDFLLRETLALDPLDWWARYLTGQPMRCDLQTGLDVAHDCARGGLYTEAIAILESLKPVKNDLPDQSWGAEPLVQYTLGWLHERAGEAKAAAACYREASGLPPDYCHPARLEEIAVFESAQRHNPDDARACYYLGNLFYDRRRYKEAICLWERSAKVDSDYSIVWRNLGVACFNVLHNKAKARVAFDRAFQADPSDARLLFERDQLWKRMGEKPEKRLHELQKNLTLVLQRDDLSVELCALFNQTGQHGQALELLGSRRFQPWEGGEGAALGQYTRAHLALGRAALAAGQAAKARAHFEAALVAPKNLGEAKHLLTNDSDIQLWLGRTAAAEGDRQSARACWESAARSKGDFQEMSVRAYSEMTCYSALAWKELGKAKMSMKLLRDLLAFAKRLEKTPAKMDYFATSLPTMLLFEDDLQYREKTRALFLQAQAWHGLGHVKKARVLLEKVLRRDPNHALASDLLAEATS